MAKLITIWTNQAFILKHIDDGLQAHLCLLSTQSETVCETVCLL